MIAISDQINFLSKLTPRRIANMLLVYFSYHYSKATTKPIQLGLPISIAIEPTTACNLGCPECPSGLKQFTRKTGNLKIEFNKKIIDQMADTLAYITFYFQGEPYINPDFLAMVKYAHSKNIYTSTSTNAHFLDDKNARATIESGLDRLIISIDGATQEIYEQYRKQGELNKVIAGAKNIVKWKLKLKSKTPHVIFQFLVVRPNEHQISKVKKLAKDIGVDEVKLKTAQVYDYENGNKLIPTNAKYSRYKQSKDGKYQIKGKQQNACWRLWHSPVITWDGHIVPCCFDKDAKHQMGKLNGVSFKEIWKNDQYHSFRNKVMKSRQNIDICKNCSEGTKVWIN